MNKEMTTLTITKKNKKKIKDLTNRYDFKTQDDFIGALLKIESKFVPELKAIKK